MEIIEASTKHVPAILDLWDGLISYHRKLDAQFTPKENGREIFSGFVSELMEGEESIVLVAADESGVAGFTMARIQESPPTMAMGRYVYITDMMVDPGRRKKGVGAALVSRVKEWTRGKGLSMIQIMASSHNQPGISFWESQGFRESVKEMFIEI